VISGAGPSVLVLATTATVDAVLALGGERWRPLRPGVPEQGVIVRPA
jgi:homoserine kinase